MPVGTGTRTNPISAKEIGLASVLFTAVTVLLAYPVSIHPSSLRIDMGIDGDLGWYLLSWDSHAFLHKPWAIFDANIFYPDRYTLAYGENIIGLAFFAAPVIWLTGNAPLATTLVSLLSCILCGLGAYVLARRLGLSVAAAVICGLIFEASPPRFFRIGQITLTNIQWIPFALASTHAYLDDGRKRDLRLAALFVSLQVLSSGHGAVFVTLSLLMLGIYRFALGEPWRLWRRVRDFGVTSAVLLMPAVLIFAPYRAVQELAGLRRGLGSWDTTMASFLASPSDFHRLVYRQIGATSLLDASVTLFPGVLAILLAVIAVGSWWRRPRAESAQAGARGARGARVARGAVGAFALEVVVAMSVVVGTALLVGAVFGLHVGGYWLDAPDALLWAWGICAAASVLRAAMRKVGQVESSGLRRPALVLLATVGLFGASAPARAALGAGDGLEAEYFANATWGGAPSFTAVDTRLSLPWIAKRWGGTAPEQYSVRWRGYLAVPRSGRYTLATRSDDGSEVYLDGLRTPIVDNAGLHGPQTQSGTAYLTQGPHLVEVRYAQGGAEGLFLWTWARDGGAMSAVPLWALSRRPTTYGRTLVVRGLDWLRLGLSVGVLLASLWLVRTWLSAGAGQAISTWAAAMRGDAPVFYGILTAAMFGLALGPPYGLWQYVYWMPGFNFIRASSRFSLVALLGLAVLAGVGFDAIARGWSSRRRTAWAVALGLLLMVEYAAIPLGYTKTELDIPAVDRWLDQQPKPFVVAEVPARGERDQVDYMMHSTAHWQKTVHGYHGWTGAFHNELFADMRTFPNERSLSRLEEIGVTYLVVHQERYGVEEWPAVERGLAAYASRLTLERVDGTGRVYRVLRARRTAP